MKLGDYLSVKQASELSGYSERHLRYLIHDNKLERVKVGSMWFIAETSLLDYMAAADEMKRTGMDNRYKSQDISED
jgi:excisionase family DNA binding protein